MRATTGLPLLACLALLALPAVSAQDHAHAAAGPIALAHDGPPDGRQFVGNLAHFAAIAHGDDAIPDFHQDVPMRISLDGVVLFETTADSGHDYDGVNIVDIAFPHAGTYLVEALGADGGVVASFGGEVVEGATVPVRLGRLQAPSDLVLAGQPVRFDHEVLADATRVDHTDCLWEVLQGGASWFRTKTHTHDEAQSLTYVFPDQGTYTVRTTCFQAYPSAKATLFLPLVDTVDVVVLPGPPTAVGTVPTVPGVPPVALNAVVAGAAGELQLVGTFDPQTVVGTNTLQHLTVLALDPVTGIPRQHVDFTARLDGPGGLVFQSDTLHEYDGMYELATRQAVPGVYTLTVTADAGSWTDSLQMAYVVVAPVAPTSAGLVAYALDGPTDEGFILAAAATSGPFAHSEVEVTAFGSGPVPDLRAKLHTHADGTFRFQYAAPTDGYTLAFDGFPLMPEAVLVQPMQFHLDAPSAPTSATPDAQPAQDAVSLGAPLLLVALATLGLAYRRR